MGRLRSAITVAAVAAGAIGLLQSAAAGARALPSLLANTRCAHPCSHLVGIYKVRPSTVVLSEAAGGNLKLTWSSWTATSASGSGTSVVSNMGATTTTNIMVVASDPKRGHFQHLAVTFELSSGNQVAQLHVKTTSGSPGWWNGSSQDT